MQHRDATAISDRLQSLATNFFWSWHAPTQHLFERIAPAIWRASNHSPLTTIAAAGPERLQALAAEPGFVSALEVCERALEHYLQTPTWYAKRKHPRMRVAYFCMEYALHESVPIYSGGLGVLAGDHLKSASDLGVPLCAVGLMYRRGFYTQHLDARGATLVEQPANAPECQPMEDTGQVIAAPLGPRNIYARVWKVRIGRVPLYLLDTDLQRNRKADRSLTAQLYSGDQDLRIRQELLLGIGGVLALQAVGEKPTVFHLNEGHAAFCTLQRLKQYRDRGWTLARAQKTVQASTVFTTHTPVPAGHDRFDPAHTWKYLAPLAPALGLDRAGLLGLGHEQHDDGSSSFCMTVLALNLSGHRNGVSKLHGEVSREMWQGAHEAKTAGEVPIGHVTNGIHTRTWLAPEADQLYRKYLAPRWDGSAPEYNPWERVERIPDEALWALRNTLRAKLVNAIRQRVYEQMLRRGESEQAMAIAHQLCDERVLTVGFARRFATYKRAPLVFADLARIETILNHSKRPVQLVFAGKAHPADIPGQQLIKKIHALSRRPEFRGRVVLLENYDMALGRLLTSGCDVWLNNPIRPHEASGTSGMKPPLHGGLNCSVLDGWWPECYDGSNGWQIGDGAELSSRAKQDQQDALSIYELLERQIAPLFYSRDAHGLPTAWLAMMRASMRSVCAAFSTQRMVGDYVNKYYLPATAKAPGKARSRGS